MPKTTRRNLLKLLGAVPLIGVKPNKKINKKTLTPDVHGALRKGYIVYEDNITGVCVCPDGSMIIVPDTGRSFSLPWQNANITCERVPGAKDSFPIYLAPGWKFWEFLDWKGATGRADPSIFPKSAIRARKYAKEHSGLDAVVIEIGTVGPGEIPMVSLAIPDINGDWLKWAIDKNNEPESKIIEEDEYT